MNLPDYNDYYKNASLYSQFDVSNEDKDWLFEILYTLKTIDIYCPKCDSISVFSPDDIRPKKQLPNRIRVPIENGNDLDNNIFIQHLNITKNFTCSRDKTHKAIFFIQLLDSKLRKIGQYPSISDLNTYSIKEYRSILGNDYYLEFNKSIGLISHGVGVGAFVYLRRILENFIILPAYIEAKKASGWNDDEYQKKRIRERITVLKKYLPDFLTENGVLYSIISKGIHELTEDECIEYYPILKECIEFVLTEMKAKKRY